jgi:aspartate/methionine/tyrosine aminotransferase
MKTVEKTLIRFVNDQAGPDCLNLGLGEPSFPTPAPILAHVREHLAEWKLGYTPNEGYRELRELIAVRESAEAGVRIAPERVIVTMGSEEALSVLLHAAVEPGDEVLIPDPGFPVYELITKLTPGTAVRYPLRPERRFRLKAADVLAGLTDKTRVVILNSPNNPTGAVYEENEWAALAAGLKGTGIYTVTDDCYRALVYGPQAPSMLGRYENAVQIGSLSKSHSMTGWRIGWIVVPAGIAATVGAVHHLNVICAPSVSQRAAIFALSGGADAACAANLDELRRRRNWALAGLREYTGLTAEPPEGAFYIFAQASQECRRAGGSLVLCLRLIEEERVVVTPGAAFGPGGEGWLRISFANLPETIEEGLKRLGRLLDRLRK